MNISQFRKDTLRTLPNLGSTLLNSLHMTVGIMTEISEIQSAFEKAKQVDGQMDIVNLSEEWADVMWYMANYANIHNLKINDADVYEYEIHRDFWPEMIISSGDLLDLDKKYLAYGKEPSLEKRQIIFTHLNYYVIKFALFYNINIEETLERNINKLKTRYPEKFDVEKAINRNLEEERLVLEGKK